MPQSENMNTFVIMAHSTRSAKPLFVNYLQKRLQIDLIWSPPNGAVLQFRATAPILMFYKSFFASENLLKSLISMASSLYVAISVSRRTL